MIKQYFLFQIGFLSLTILQAQPPEGIIWSADGAGYYEQTATGIEEVGFPSLTKTHIVDTADLIPTGSSRALSVRNFFISPDKSQLLIYTNSKKVWRYDTRGDYWILNLHSKILQQAGKGLPESSMMYAKFSPDSKLLAYVSNHNIYVEDIASGKIKPLTGDGTEKIINGTFDWAYEEEFSCRDGFRWSNDGKKIASWQIDASTMKNFLLIDNTDSLYSFTKPVEYPIAGEDPSSCKIGIVDVDNAQLKWMNVPGDAVQHYIPRMEWTKSDANLIIEQLNRKQNESKIYLLNTSTGEASQIFTEKNNAWIDTKSRWHDNPRGWEWLNDGKSFIWVSENDGWRHFYVISSDGKKKRLLTKENYDAIDINSIDEKTGYIYFTASPDNATQLYLYRIKIDGSQKAQRVSPPEEPGTHYYNISPNGQFAYHYFSNASTSPLTEWVSLPAHKSVS